MVGGDLRMFVRVNFFFYLLTIKAVVFIIIDYVANFFDKFW